jgi:hypothetical protein
MSESKRRNKEKVMSFRKVTPVKKARETVAPAPATKKKAAKKAAPKRRPVSHKG